VLICCTPNSDRGRLTGACASFEHAWRPQPVYKEGDSQPTPPEHQTICKLQLQPRPGHHRRPQRQSRQKRTASTTALTRWSLYPSAATMALATAALEQTITRKNYMVSTQTGTDATANSKRNFLWERRVDVTLRGYRRCSSRAVPCLLLPARSNALVSFFFFFFLLSSFLRCTAYRDLDDCSGRRRRGNNWTRI
jgi:hypothetical protein